MIPIKYEDLVCGKKYYIEFSGKLTGNECENKYSCMWIGTFINYPHNNAAHFIHVQPVTTGLENPHISTSSRIIEEAFINMTECNFSRLRHRYYIGVDI